MIAAPNSVLEQQQQQRETIVRFLWSIQTCPRRVFTNLGHGKPMGFLENLRCTFIEGVPFELRWNRREFTEFYSFVCVCVRVLFTAPSFFWVSDQLLKAFLFFIE